MADHVEKMLRLLVESYRKSKKDTGTNVTARRTALDPVRLYPGYRKNDGEFEQIAAVNEAAAVCGSLGFLTYEKKTFSSEIDKIYLNDDRVEDAERYLKEHYGYVPKGEKRSRVEAILTAYEGRAPAADAECQRLRAALEKNRIPKDYLQSEQILKALVLIENNQKPLYLREASMLIYGDSKYFEENTLEPVCAVLRRVYEKPCGETGFFDEILEDHHIIREKQRLCMKGAATLWIDGKPFDTGAFQSGVEFFSDELGRIERVEIRARRLVTVENQTAYFRCSAKDTVFFYLGGYASRGQRDFLKLIYRDNRRIRYEHFGDIDAGGFYIYEHLRRVTAIPFGLEQMSVRQLRDPRYSACLQPLTETDRSRLASLEKRPEYQETASYMLENNVKLEQEIISLHLYAPGGESAEWNEK